MFEILTAAEMQKTEAESGVPAAALVQAAGVAVAEAVIARIAPCTVLVLCGPGTNGADGIAAAEQLRAKGWTVRIAAMPRKGVKQTQEELNSNLSLKGVGLVIDAVFGTGFHDALPPEIVALFDKIRTKNISSIAIDVPTGIDATQATAAEGTLAAVMTVTFTRRKPAHLLLPAKTLCGRVQLAHIGISDESVAAQNTQAFENHPGLWLRDFPLPGAASHKYTRGHAVVVGGAKRTGAACLAAAAAQKTGAGLVTIAAPASVANIYMTYRASLMVDDFSNSENLREILRDPRKNTVVIGCGLGTDNDAAETLKTALSFNKAFIIDGDALQPGRIWPDNAVLTPHEGEFARVFPDITGNKLERARAAARAAKAIVVLKGADTVIAAPDGTAIVHPSAPATLATAGSGDVLAGMIGGLAAQNMPLFMSAAAAVWLHAEAARHHGLGLTAEDIIISLNHVLNALLLPAAAVP
jgi:ADP-dependent NAD(P)H-hydrate dehydratase / NAD(P)H-hydrate epimerase